MLTRTGTGSRALGAKVVYEVEDYLSRCVSCRSDIVDRGRLIGGMGHDDVAIWVADDKSIGKSVQGERKDREECLEIVSVVFPIKSASARRHHSAKRND